MRAFGLDGIRPEPRRSLRNRHPPRMILCRFGLLFDAQYECIHLQENMKKKKRET